MNKRFFGIALAFVAMTAMTSITASAKDRFTVGYANLADSDVWLKKLKTDFTDTAKSDPSLNLVFADANGDVNESLTPRSPERIGHNDGAATELVPEAPGGSIGIVRQYRCKISTFDIRLVHACIGANVAEAAFRYEDPAVHFHDSPRLG